MSFLDLTSFLNCADMRIYGIKCELEAISNSVHMVNWQGQNFILSYLSDLLVNDKHLIDVQLCVK